jgi:hypothetical protein
MGWDEVARILPHGHERKMPMAPKTPPPEGSPQGFM